MAKTYNTIPSVATGDVYTATAHNNIVTNVNNYRVPPACVLERTTAQTIGNASDTRVQFGSAPIDTDGMATTGASAKITIQTAGIYIVSLAAKWTANATGRRVAGVWKNNSGSARIMISAMQAAADLGASNAISRPVSLAVNDTLDVYVYQTSGGNLDLLTEFGDPAASVSAIWVGQVS